MADYTDTELQKIKELDFPAVIKSEVPAVIKSEVESFICWDFNEIGVEPRILFNMLGRGVDFRIIDRC